MFTFTSERKCMSIYISHKKKAPYTTGIVYYILYAYICTIYLHVHYIFTYIYYIFTYTIYIYYIYILLVLLYIYYYIYAGIVYIKGASEVILSRCTHYINESGEICILTNNIRIQLEKSINDMAKRALRTIILGIYCIILIRLIFVLYTHYIPLFYVSIHTPSFCIFVPIILPLVLLPVCHMFCHLFYSP